MKYVETNKAMLKTANPKKIGKSHFKLKKLACALMTSLVMTSALLTATPTHAQSAPLFGSNQITSTVRLPNSEYTETTIDMRVKALGGEVRLDRTWANGRWYLNANWSNLRFISDPLDESIKTVDRSGTLFERSGHTDLYAAGEVYIRKTDTGWRWYDRDGNWITYDPAGRMTGYGDRNDIKVDFVLDEEGRRTQVKDHHGQVVFTFAYDEQEHLIEAKDRSGRRVVYQWEGDRLTQVTDVLGNAWLYGYDSQGQLTQRTEPDGGVIKIGYAYTIEAPKPAMNSGKNVGQVESSQVVSTGADQLDTKIARVGRMTDKTGAVTLWHTEYDRTTRRYTITVEDPLGKKTTTEFDAQGRMLSQSVNGVVREVIQRDGEFQRKIIDERGLVTTVQYDNAKHPIKIVSPDGSIMTYEYDSILNKPTRYINALGHSTAWEYDAEGNTIRSIAAQGMPEQRVRTWTYGSYAQPTTITLGEGGNAITWHQIFDENGNVKTMTSANGNSIELTYNIQGLATSIKNPLGNVWTYAYNDAGHQVSSTDPLNNTVHYSTDTLGRITQATDALGNTLTYSYQYERSGSVEGWRVTRTNALGEATSYQYDAVGRLTNITLPSGDTVTQGFDKNGRLQQQTDAAGNTIELVYGESNSGLDGMVVSALYPTYQETYKYNALGLPTQVTQILSEQEQLISRMSYNAEGQSVGVTDSAGRTTYTEYDALGNAIKQVDPLGGETQQTFDLLGNITSVTDANGNTHRFEYDANGNKVKEITPSGQVTQFVYNAVNQLTQRTDAVGHITAYQYDATGRVTQATYTAKGQSISSQTVDYAYNSANQLVGLVQKDPSGNVQSQHVYTLDALGRITQESITYGSSESGFTKTIAYGYDADGNRNAITYPDGQTQTYTYEHGRLKAVQLPNGQSMTWDGYQWQRPTQTTAPGAAQTLSYDALQRTQGIEVKADNTSLMNRGYTYDAAGNITQRQTEDGVYSYGYDLLDRITQGTPPASVQDILPRETYAYDGVHNRIGSAQQPGEWLYNADNQLLQFGSGTDQTTYTYTANGHVATQTKNGQLLTYTYDATDRLISVHHGTVASGREIARYAYDPMGRRISKTVNGETTFYLYTDEGLLAELDDAGNILVAYGWQANSMYGTAPLWLAQVNNGNLQTAEYHFLYTDHLGTVQMAVNSNGQTTWGARSEAFGKIILNPANEITMNLRFPGQYFDAETNTHYNYFRDYNPNMGRYIQRDPIGLHGGDNVYTYTKGQPIIQKDPFGLRTCGSGWSDYIVPDNPAGYPFSESCVQHDDCYDKCGGATQEECDKIFLESMLDACDERLGGYGIMGDTELNECYITAAVYYKAVANLGEEAFKNARLRCNPCSMPSISIPPNWSWLPRF